MKNSLKKVSFALVLMFLSFSAFSQNQKIAYLDYEEISKLMPEYKAFTSEIESYGKILQKQLEGEQAKMQQYYTDVTNKVQQGLIAPAQQKIEEEKLMKMQEEYQRKEMKMREDMISKQEELIKPIEDKLLSALKAVAKSNGYAYVLDKKAFLYLDGGEDISSKVKVQLGIQ